MQWYENPDIMGPFMMMKQIVDDFCDSPKRLTKVYDFTKGIDYQYQTDDSNVVRVDFNRGMK